jgi:hypothetical protein
MRSSGISYLPGSAELRPYRTWEVTDMMIYRADCDNCQLCRSTVEKAGYFVVEDDQNSRQFLCETHLIERLRAGLNALRTISQES